MKTELILCCDELENDILQLNYNSDLSSSPLEVAMDTDTFETVFLSKEKAEELYEFLYKALGKDDK